MKRILLIIIASMMSMLAISQLHTHDDHHEDNAEFGFGAANALVYNLTEKEFNFGFHVHALKLFNNKFGVGIGYEGVSGENYHQTATVFGKFFLTDFLSLNFGPGLVFPNKEHDNFLLSGHFEIATAFEVGQVHIGPMIGIGADKEESHLSLGLHLGLHF